MTGVLDSPTLGRRRTMLYFTVVSVLGSLLLSFTWYMGPGALFAGNVLMRFSVLVPYTIMYELLKSQYIVTFKHKCTGALTVSDFVFCLGTFMWRKSSQHLTAMRALRWGSAHPRAWAVSSLSSSSRSWSTGPR